MGAMLMHQRKPVCYHSKTFLQDIVNYPIYDKELHALVQSVKEWKQYVIGKDTIIHIDH